MPFTGAVLCIKKEIMMVRGEVFSCFSGYINAYKRKEWGKKTGNDLLRCGILHSVKKKRMTVAENRF
jgi:hypothetical protein